MANDISSQITSTALNQVSPVEQGEKTAGTVTSIGNSNQQASVDSVNKTQVPLENASNRQDVAVNQGGLSNPAVAEKSQLEKAVSDINEYVQTVNRELQFRVDDALPLGRSVVTVVDADTQETIREFPSEQALSLARSLKEQAGEAVQSQIEGLIISAQA